MKRALHLVALCTLSPLAAAQVTTSNIQIGGPNSLSSEGGSGAPQNDNPGVLADGFTLARGVYEFTLDTSGVPVTLEVRVYNTSPVVVGENNPILTNVYFNAPTSESGSTGVTGISLVSTTWGTGSPSTPTFSPSYQDGVNVAFTGQTNKADGFGYFDVALSTGSNRGIANPAADTIVQPTQHGYIPTFRFDVSGVNLTSLVAADFTSTLSNPPPPDRLQYGVGHFKAGGPLSTSAFISNDNPPLYVDIASFRGQSGGGADKLAWITLAEVDNVGFNLYRQAWVPSGGTLALGEAVQVNTTMIPAQGSPVSGATYLFDTRSTGRPSLYWLEDIDIHGIQTWHGPILVR